MGDLIDIAQQIYDCKEALDKMKPEIKSRAQKRASALAEYDKKIAITIMGLKNGKTFEMDNQRIVDPPVTVMEKLAKGLCYQEKLAMELADAEYKSLMSNIETTKAQLNGLQSINKHLE